MNVYRTSLEEDQQDRPLQGAKDGEGARRWIPGNPFWVAPTFHPRGKSCRLANNNHATSQTLLSTKVSHLSGVQQLFWKSIISMSQPCGDIIFSYDQTIHQKSHEKSIQLRSSGGNHSTSQYTFHSLMFQKKKLILFSVLWKVWFEKKLFSIRNYFAPWF